MTDFTQTQTGQSRAPWQILTACSFILCINAAFPIYGASVINTAMASAMEADRSLLGLLVSVNMAITGLTAPLMGALVGRAGARFTLICGSILMILGALTMATLVNSVLPAVLAFGVLFGLAMSAGGFVANQACVAGWFKEDRARPFAILYATMGLGGFVAAPLINGAIGLTGDWRSGWIVFAVLGAVALFLSIFIVRDASDTDGDSGFGPPTDATGTGGINSASVWIVILCIMAAGASTSLYIAHGLALLNDFGHPATAATTSMSMMAGSTLIGNFVIGASGERFGVRRTLAGGSITFAIGLILLANAHSTALLYLYPVFFGAGWGAVQVGGMALLSKCVAPHRFAAAIGIAISLQTLASATTPFLGGWIFDATRTYVPMILTLAALNGLAAIALLLSARIFPDRA